MLIIINNHDAITGIQEARLIIASYLFSYACKLPKRAHGSSIETSLNLYFQVCGLVILATIVTRRKKADVSPQYTGYSPKSLISGANYARCLRRVTASTTATPPSSKA